MIPRPRFLARHAVSLAWVVGMLQAAPIPTAAQAPGMDHGAEPLTVVYLVRHAERAEDGTADPPISEAGEARAALLTHVLGDAGITRVLSTDYRRTRSTAEPLARRLGLEVESYDPRDLVGLAASLRTGGRTLVVGHSNTTPELVAALGGNPGTPVGELEYDRLYVVTLTHHEAVTVLLRYGDPGPR